MYEGDLLIGVGNLHHGPLLRGHSRGGFVFQAAVVDRSSSHSRRWRRCTPNRRGDSYVTFGPRPRAISLRSVLSDMRQSCATSGSGATTRSSSFSCAGWWDCEGIEVVSVDRMPTDAMPRSRESRCVFARNRAKMHSVVLIERTGD